MKLIEEMYAFVAVDEDDQIEGITAFRNTDGGWMPMVGADQERMDSFRPMAQMLANQSGQTIKLIHFSNRAEVTTIEPDGGPPDPFTKIV